MTHSANNAQSSNIRLLNRFYRIFFFVCIVFLTIGVPFVFYRKAVSAAVVLVMMLAVLLAWRLSRHGQPQKSLLFFASGLWLVLIGLLYAGLPPFGAATAVAMAVMLAVVVHLRAGVIFGTTYLLAWLLYIALNSAHLAPAPYFVGNPLTGWFIGAVAFWLVLLPIPELVRSLRHGKERFEAILNATPEGIFLLDRDGVLLAVNVTAARRLNLDPPQLLGQCVFDKFPPDVSATRRATLAEVFRTGQTKYVEDRRADRSFAVNYYPVVGADGAVASVAVFAADITERQQAEQAALALAQRNQLLMQTATEGIHVLDSTGRLVEANGAFARMLGYTAQELANANAVQWEASWSGEQLRGKIDEMIQHGGAFETVHRRKDGSLLDVEVHASGVCIEGQSYLYAASRDIAKPARRCCPLPPASCLLRPSPRCWPMIKRRPLTTP
jgi:PAS domain S-box-containing protein